MHGGLRHTLNPCALNEILKEKHCDFFHVNSNNHILFNILFGIYRIDQSYFGSNKVNVYDVKLKSKLQIQMLT